MSKLYLYLGGLIAIALAFGTYTYHERAIGAAKEIAALKVSSDALQKAADAKVQQLATDYAATVAAHTETFDAQTQVDATQHASDLKRLSDFDAYRRSHEAVGGPGSGPAAAGQGTASTFDVDAVIAGLEHVSIELADSTRATAAALKLCMADRDSLTGK